MVEKIKKIKLTKKERRIFKRVASFLKNDMKKESNNFNLHGRLKFNMNFYMEIHFANEKNILCCIVGAFEFFQGSLLTEKQEKKFSELMYPDGNYYDCSSEQALKVVKNLLKTNEINWSITKKEV